VNLTGCICAIRGQSSRNTCNFIPQNCTIFNRANTPALVMPITVNIPLTSHSDLILCGWFYW